MEFNTYRLTRNRQPVTWQLPTKDELLERFIELNGEKKSVGYRKIIYVPGSESIWLEDQQGDFKRVSPIFEHGDLRVPKNNILLNELLQKHRYFNEKYILWSDETETSSKLETLRFKGEARQLIEGADEDKIKAIALTIKGQGSFNWNAEKCELYLREYAESKPKKLKEIMDEKDYESKFIASQAFVKGIVKENTNRTAVLWSDSEGVIVQLAKGENGIKELGRFLSTSNEDSIKVIQSIGERLDKIALDSNKYGGDVETIESKNKEIAKLKAQLKAKSPNTESEAKDREIAELRLKLEVANKPVVDEKSVENTPVVTGNDEITLARAKYLEVFEKNVPLRYKNNINWIIKKLNE